MPQPTIEELMKNNLSSLPSVVRDLINDPHVPAVIDRLVEENKLDEIRAEMLAEEVGYVLFKVTSVDKFEETIIWKIQLDKTTAKKINEALQKEIFKPIQKFLRTGNNKVTLSLDETKNQTPAESKSAETEDLNHHSILNEIETPTPSLKAVTTTSTNPSTPKPSAEKPVTNMQVMPKGAQDIMTSANSEIIPTTKGPTLQEAINNSMPDIGGFIPATNTLASSQKVASALDSKLTTATATATKEVFIPKKIDPYREPIE